MVVLYAPCKIERKGGEWIVGKIKRSGLNIKPAGLSIIKPAGL
jgi:hypothetical protein